MAGKKVNPIALVVGALLVGGLGYYFLSKPGSSSSSREVEGVLTHIDDSRRLASMELPDPKGGTMEVSGVIPEACPITRDGKTISLAELKAGDRVRVLGRVEKKPGPDGAVKRNLVAERISVLSTMTEG